MLGPMNSLKPTPSLRQKQNELTKGLILKALAKVILEKGVHNFSVQTVADAAGVSHRTVYRHYPTREALLEGLADYLETLLEQQRYQSVPENASDVLKAVTEVFHIFEDVDIYVKAMVLARLSTGHRPASTLERDTAFQKIIKDLAPKLDDNEIDRAASLIRYLVSSTTWMILTDNMGLSTKEALQGVKWAVEVLFEDLKKRNRSSSKK